MIKDNWEVVAPRKDFKYVQHKDYPFIKFDLMGYPGYRSGGGKPWKVEMRKWSSKVESLELMVHYKKLTKDKMSEIFEQLIKQDKAKAIIFEYLFEGKYEI